jgi:polysaccharide pyruvyl transferase WcaK-like protein
VRYPLVADQFDAVADDWLCGRGGPDANAFLDRFRAADLVLLNGESSIYRDNASAVRELFLVWLAKERLGIPSVFVNGGVHLTDVVPVVPPMVRKTFPRLDAVAVREPRSLRNLRDNVPEVEARMFPDAAFAFAPDDAEEGDAIADIRRRLDGAPYFCFVPGQMPMDHQGPSSALHQLITALKGSRLRAVLICRDPTDAFLMRVANETDSLFVGSISDFREYMALTAGAEFVVSGRYHSTILSAIVGCPAVTFGSNNHKVHGACELLDDVLGAPYDATHLRPDLDHIVERTRDYAANRDQWREELKRICAQRRAEVDQLGELVSGVVRPRV